MKLVNQHQSNWDDHTLFAIRTSKQKSTKYTPFEMFSRYLSTCSSLAGVNYNRKAKLLAELEICSSNPDNSNSNPEDHNQEEDLEAQLDDRMQTLIAIRQKMFADAESNIKDAQS